MFESPSELECLIDKRGQTHSELFERPTFYLQAIMIIALWSAFPNLNDEICNHFSDYIEGFQKKKTVDTVEPASIMKKNVGVAIADGVAEWRNGRRWGFKIPCP